MLIKMGPRQQWVNRWSHWQLFMPALLTRISFRLLPVTDKMGMVAFYKAPSIQYFIQQAVKTPADRPNPCRIPIPTPPWSEHIKLIFGNQHHLNYIINHIALGQFCILIQILRQNQEAPNGWQAIAKANDDWAQWYTHMHHRTSIWILTSW